MFMRKYIFFHTEKKTLKPLPQPPKKFKRKVTDMAGKTLMWVDMESIVEVNG